MARVYKEMKYSLINISVVCNESPVKTQFIPETELKHHVININTDKDQLIDLTGKGLQKTSELFFFKLNKYLLSFYFIPFIVIH